MYSTTFLLGKWFAIHECGVPKWNHTFSTNYQPKNDTMQIKISSFGQWIQLIIYEIYLHSHHNFNISDGSQFVVAWFVTIFDANHNSISEKSFVNGDTVLLCNDHSEKSRKKLASFGAKNWVKWVKFSSFENSKALYSKFDRYTMLGDQRWSGYTQLKKVNILQEVASKRGFPSKKDRSLLKLPFCWLLCRTKQWKAKDPLKDHNIFKMNAGKSFLIKS